MGRNFSQRPSHLLSIDDEKMAIDFDRCCNARLELYDIEREKRQLESTTMGAVGHALGGTSERAKPIVLNQ